MKEMMKKHLIEVRGLKVYFGSSENPLRAVDGVSFTVPESSTVALVGESGCGKSVTSLALARLVQQPPGYYAGGKVLYKGENVLEMSDREVRALRGGEIAYIFQEPGTALNPVFTVGFQIMEAVKLHRNDVDPRDEALRLMKLVGLPDPEHRIKSYPHEMSGGMQQRIMIAMALASKPSVLIADEPTTALDVTVQAQILELLRDIQKEMGMSILLITHNLGLVADTADFVYVMYAGRIMEYGPVESVLGNPMHPYTLGLLQAVPRLSGKNSGDEIYGIPGTLPDPNNMPGGCRFAPRCVIAENICRAGELGIAGDVGESVKSNHEARCHFPLEKRLWRPSSE